MKKTGKIAILAVFLFLLLALPAGAATKNAFVKKGGYYYYYNAKGKKAKGLTKVGKKTWYFDSKGRQLLGWRVINGRYYYFNIKNGKNGTMAKSKWVDGIYLNSSGAATGGSEAARKLWVLSKAQLIVDSLTKQAQSMASKRKVIYAYMKTAFKNVRIADFVSSYSNWDVVYAEYLFSKGAGDCYAYACGFAYLLNAIGYNGVVVEHSGDHSWVSWKGRYFDPHWDMTYKTMLCYNVTEDLSGTGGRPHWREICIGAKPIDTMG